MGYRQAAEKAQEILDDIAIDSVDEETLVRSSYDCYDW